MAKQVQIQFSLHLTDGKYTMTLVDPASVVQKCVDTFLVDSGRGSIALMGVLQERIEYKTRSQLGYYFGVVVPCITAGLIDRGYKELNDKLTDDFLRSKFLSVSIANEDTGEVLESIRSLSSLFKDDMIEYLNNCIMFAQVDLQVSIPEPTK